MHDVKSSRAQVWLEGSGDWAWPGSGGGEAAVAELLPPSWVPALPRRSSRWASASAPPRRYRGPGAHSAGCAGATARACCWPPWRLACVGLGLEGRANIEGLTGVQAASHPSAARACARTLARRSAPAATAAERSCRSAATRPAARSTRANYASQALHGEGSFLIYLPPGYASTTAHYPVIYLLHGDDQTDSSFLQIGVQSTLDRLIARHAIPPVIAVMIQGGPGSNNWLNTGNARYEAYVLEVQRLVDRMLPTIADRAGPRDRRLLDGWLRRDAHRPDAPAHFSAVESWLGFFNGLEGRCAPTAR